MISHICKYSVHMRGPHTIFACEPVHASIEVWNQYIQLMLVCVCVCVCVCACARACMRACMYAPTFLYYMYIHIHTYLCMCECFGLCVLCRYEWIYMVPCVFWYAYMCVHVSVYINVCTYAWSYMCVYCVYPHITRLLSCLCLSMSVYIVVYMYMNVYCITDSIHACVLCIWECFYMHMHQIFVEQSNWICIIYVCVYAYIYIYIYSTCTCIYFQMHIYSGV
jgi:hypothetical protein